MGRSQKAGGSVTLAILLGLNIIGMVGSLGFSAAGIFGSDAGSAVGLVDPSSAIGARLGLKIAGICGRLVGSPAEGSSMGGELMGLVPPDWLKTST